MKNTSRFVAIEGPGGAGKAALADGLELYFAEKGLDVLLTKEPSDGLIGHRIQKIIDGKLPRPKTNYEFQRLYVEDRGAHISAIRAYLQLGHLVLSVNYWLLTLACGMLDGEVEDYVRLHKEIIGEEMIYPHLSILLDAPVDVCLERLRCNYLWLAGSGRFGNIHIINSDRPKDEVLSSAISALEPLL